MKDREYYERLISDSLDRHLAPDEQKMLQEGMTRYPELGRFEADLRGQAELIKKLPEVKTDMPLVILAKKLHKRGLPGIVWNIRVSVPLPVAALLVLVVAGSLLFSLYSKRPSETQERALLTKPIEYIQIERLKPARAVLIQQNENENQTNKEAL